MVEDYSWAGKPLTRVEEFELARSIEVGVLAWGQLQEGADEAVDLQHLVWEGEVAWGVFLRANVRLVLWAVSRSPARHFVSHSELVNEGMLGVAHALMKFDHLREIRFSTYALPWIRYRLQRCGRERNKEVVSAAAVEAVLSRTPVSESPWHWEWALSSLPRQQRQVVALRFGFTGRALSCAQTARTLGVDVRAVRGLERAALLELRDWFLAAA